MLGNLMQVDGFTAEELGFTESTAVMMFDGDPRFSALFQDTEDVTATKEQIREVRNHRADSMKDMQEAQSADFYFTVVFQIPALWRRQWGITLMMVCDGSMYGKE